MFVRVSVPTGKLRRKNIGQNWGNKSVKTLDKFVINVKVEKTLKGSLDSIPSPSPSVKIQIMGAKFAWGVKAKHCFFENKKFVDNTQ